MIHRDPKDSTKIPRSSWKVTLLGLIILAGCGGRPTEPNWIDMDQKKAEQQERLKMAIESIKNDPLMTEKQKEERLKQLPAAMEGELKLIQEAADAQKDAFPQKDG